MNRHLRAPDRTPIPDHTALAFEAVRRYVQSSPAPIVFDSGCGTGHSTLRLASVHPDSWVVGIDKSRARLRRGPGSVDTDDRPAVHVGRRTLLVRGDMYAFWRLAARENCQIAYHYLLYPNPWPKASHRARRVHGHPAFSALLRLGGQLEVRTNWLIYIEGFRAALRVAGLETAAPLQLTPESAISPFEAKYQGSGHALWRLKAELTPSEMPLG